MKREKYEIREYVLSFSYDKNNKICRRWILSKVTRYTTFGTVVKVLRITFSVLRRFKSNAIKYTVKYIKKGGAKRV